MKIHPRYFNTFVIIVAVTAALVIAITTISHLQNREEQFRQRMAGLSPETLYSTNFYHFSRDDSLSLGEFRGRFLILDFWAGWSGPALVSHEQLASFTSELSPNTAVVAASVREETGSVDEYRNAHDYPFEFVDGTSFFDQVGIPGIPSQVLIAPDGNVLEVFVGYTDSSRYDRLKTLIENHEQN